MAKTTESTAVTRLIELAQQRSVESDLDWFAPPPRKRVPREEVTQVVRVARALRTSPLTVLGAFLLGMLTVIVTTIVLRTPSSSAAPPPVAPIAAPVAAPVTAPIAAPVAAPVAVPVAVPVAPPVAAPVVVPIAPEPPPRDPIPAEVAVVAPEPIEPAPDPAPAPVPVIDRPRSKPRAVKAAARERPAAKAEPAPAALAELQIASKPPCELYVDGRKLGWTPRRGITVAPGRHTIIFRNREHDIERKVLVDARAGEVHKLIRDFTEP